MPRQIVNIVNFIRAVEPRSDVDLLRVVREQIRLIDKNGLRATFLLQYDALLLPEFTDLLRSLDPARYELGIWYEVVEQLTDACGIPWTGRWSWDWHCHCGFPVGYTKPQREAMIDEFFRKFKEVFGQYPRVFGSWLFDSHTVRYMTRKYDMDALCNCKEQYGTDGYTLWGGYYGQAYYPSAVNVFMPAQRAEEQLPAPLFRMLGSDQVRQYDFGMDPDNGANTCQGVITLEPVYCGGNGGGGGVPEWVDWYLRENFNGECLSFGYAQAGQENSFGWDAMRAGLTDQFAKFAALQREGRLTVEPMGETGRWYKETYSTTPASAITAHGAWDDPALDSVWFSDRFFRANLYGDKKSVRVRDLHIFDEGMPDPFEDTVCTANEAVYETLPAVDGNRYSGNGVVAGLYPVDETTGEPFAYEKMEFTDLGEGKARVNFGSIVFGMRDNLLLCTADRPFRLENRIGKDGGHLPTVVSLTEKALTLSYDGRTYRITLEKGTFRNAKTILSENNIVSARFTLA